MPEAILNAGKLRKIFELIKRSMLWILVRKKLIFVTWFCILSRI